MKHFYLLIVTFLLFSCTKEPLEGIYSDYFIGTWEWVRTDHYNTSGSSIDKIHTPYSTGDELEIELLEEGRLKISLNGSCYRKHRILDFEEFADEELEYYALNLELSKKKGFEEVGFFMNRAGEVDTLSSNDSPEFFGLSLGSDSQRKRHSFIRK